ncbi:membrane protein [Amycolatopsis stemonae]
MTRGDTAPDVPRTAQAVKVVCVVWSLLVFNTLGSLGPSILPIPRSVEQILTMSSVGFAFVLALAINPRFKLRPSAYLLLLTLMLVGSLAGSARLASGWGSLFRCARFALFIGTLWLISPWMDNVLHFVKHHVRVLTALLVTVAIGLGVAPGMALAQDNEGRLTGVLWPLTATQVGQYAAIAIGLSVLLWLNKLTTGRSVAIISGPALVLLLLTHTRTATAGLVVGLAVAGLSMLLTSARARKVVMWGIAVAGAGTVLLGAFIQAWLLRGQDKENFANLTGRAKVWGRLLDMPRTWFEQVFGTGLSNKSFDGLPIDNSWLAVYHEQGYMGVVIVVLFLLTLVVSAISRAPSPARACALFLVSYCLLASYTEAGLGDASPYLLHLALASWLLTTPTPDVTMPLAGTTSKARARNSPVRDRPAPIPTKVKVVEP